MEGLKTEIKATRNTNEMLRKQVKQLKGLWRVHLPSLAIGLLAGAAAKEGIKKLRKWWLTREGEKVEDEQEAKPEAAAEATAA